MLPRKLSRIGVLVTTVVTTLAFASSALAISPPAVTSAPPDPTTASAWTFEWDAVVPDEGHEIVRYEGGLPGDPVGPVTSPVVVELPEGAQVFRVQAVQQPLGGGVEVASGFTEIPFLVDRTPPTLSMSLSPAAPDGLAGWYTSLTVVRDCGDGAGSGVVTDCADLPWTQDRLQAPYTHQVADGVGLSSGPVSTAPFKFDRTKPRIDSGQPASPGPAALVADEPAFVWTPGLDNTSGVVRYELQYLVPGMADYETMATRQHVDDVGDYSARRDPDLRPDPLPERKVIKWRVVSHDAAGNFRESTPRDITIDGTIPPAPTITGGPAAPTRISSPTFSWTGTEQTYLWDLTVAGSETPVRRSGGTATQVTIANLADGDYTFRVTQVTQAGRPSAEATRSFKVDTTPPAPPAILVRPPFPALSAPTFTWQTEPGAYSRWTVVGDGGVTVIPATATPTTSVTLPPLPDGAYSFQVQQIDPAGNVSVATAEPFTLLAPLAPAPAPSTGGAAGVAAALPRQNAVRLKPKAGRTLPTRAPVLQWRKGPRGTRLYNLQIFRVTSRKGGTPRIVKVVSRFPRGLQMRAPKKNIKPGTCYVWRVWPYTGRTFTPKPVGVSNFCVASAKVLKKRAARARAAKIKAARKAAARKAAARRAAIARR